ncbi:MAG: hypothetical protein ACI4Q6_04955 [Huintestinicola sp.]
MPHGSGGGSHHGGSHRSHHSSHRSGGSSGSSVQFSKKPFKNCRRFRYFDSRGRAKYVYASSVPRRQSIFTLIFLIIFLIPFLAFTVIMAAFLHMQSKPLEKLSSDYICSGTHISDTIGVINNETQLEQTLKDFEELTGICPYIRTVHDSEWENNYDDLELYAYSVYVNTFKDEQHFLIVYSEPDIIPEDGFVDWSWEGMQGDDTDPILTEASFRSFQTDLMNNLFDESVGAGAAFERAFRNSFEYIMSPRSQTDKETTLIVVIFMTLWNTMIAAVLISAIISFVRSRRQYTEVPLDGAAEQQRENSEPKLEIYEEKEYRGPEIDEYPKYEEEEYTGPEIK